MNDSYGVRSFPLTRSLALSRISPFLYNNKCCATSNHLRVTRRSFSLRRATRHRRQTNTVNSEYGARSFDIKLSNSR